MTDPANPVPVIAQVTPQSVDAGSGAQALNITGSGFIPQTVVTLDGVALNATITPTTIATTIPAEVLDQAGTVPGLLSNPAPGGGTAPFSINVRSTAPTISGFTPETAEAGAESLTLRVLGTNFTARSQVTVDQTPVATDLISATELEAQLQAGLLRSGGTREIGARNPPPGGGSAIGGVLTLTIPAPELTALSPTLVLVGSTDPRVGATGDRFLQNSQAQIEGVGVVTDVDNRNTLTFTVPDTTTARVVDVVIVTPGGGSSDSLELTIGNPVPVLTGLNPSTIQAGDPGVEVEVTGDFVAGAQVQIEGQAVVTRFIDATRLEFDPPLDLVGGVHDVTVVHSGPGGGRSASLDLTVTNPVPQVDEVDPAQVTIGETTGITVRGSRFASGATIQFDGQDLDTDVVNSTTLTAQVTPDEEGPVTVTVTNPGPGDLTSTSLEIVVVAPPNPEPDITGLDPEPSNGLIGPGDTLAIQGSGFLADTTASIDGDPVAVNFVSGNELRMEVPGLEIGDHRLVVENPPTSGGGGGSDSFDFTLGRPVPVITSLEPDEVDLDNVPAELEVVGTGFVAVSVVEIDGVAVPTDFGSTTRLTYVLPDGIGSGDVDVRVVTTAPGGGTSNALTLRLNAPTPELDQITPNTGDQGTDVGVTLSGDYFESGDTSIAVSGTGVTVTDVTVTDANGLTATLTIDPDAELGEREVRVTTTGGTSGPVGFTIEQAPPVLTAITPESGEQGTTVDVTLSGDYFESGDTSMVVSGTGVTVTDVTVTDATELTATLTIDPDAELGERDVTLTTGGGTSDPVGFTIEPAPVPELDQITPDTGRQGTTVDVTLFGANFETGATTVAVSGTGVTVTDVVVVNMAVSILTAGDPAAKAATLTGDASITATLTIDASAELGGREVTVTTGVGTSEPLTFTIETGVPTLTSIAPESGQQGTTLDVTLFGANFESGNTTVEVSGTGVTVTGVEVVDVAPSALTADEGSASAATLTGDASLTATLTIDASAELGGHDVTVSTSVGTSEPLAFTVEAGVPTLTSIAPALGARGTTVEVIITGTGFQDGNTTVDVSGTRVTLSNITVVNATTLTANFSVAGVAVLGLREVTVTVGDLTSNSLIFTVAAAPNPVPTITGLDPDPSAEIVDEGDTVTILGSGFLNQSVVTVDGVVVASDFTDINHLTFVAPDFSEGAHTLIVTNVATDGGGGGSATFSFTTTARALELSPSSALIDDDEIRTFTVSLGEVQAADTSVSFTTTDSGTAGFVVSGSTVATTTVTILAGGVSSTVEVKGVSAGTASVTATAAGFTAATSAITVVSSFGTIVGVTPDPIIIPLGGTLNFTVERSSDTQSAAADFGTSVAPLGIATVPSGVSFASGSTTASATMTPVAVGSATLTVAGPDAPSLLNGRVINFVPSGVSTPSSVGQQTSGTVLDDFNNAVPLPDSDDGFQEVSLPFSPSFPFFGKTYTTVFVNINGNLTFGTGDVTNVFDVGADGELEELLKRARIFPLAADLFLRATSSVFTNTLTVDGQQAFVITYDKMGLFGQPGLIGLNTFQIVLFADGAIQYRYVEINNEAAVVDEEELPSHVGAAPAPPQFDRPHVITGDGTNLYVTERNNHTVRQVALSNRRVTTLAGNGSTGTANGTGSAARFNETAGIWADGSGNLYVAERNNFAIRKVVIATGGVTTIAGLPGTSGTVNGTGTSARFGELGGLWGDGAGSLYVADAGNHAIRKIDITTNPATVSTFAGLIGSTGLVDDTATDARFNEPWGVWGDTGGNLYVGEDTNHTVRKIIIATQVVSTLAGSSALGTADGNGSVARFNRPRGLWGDDNGALYVSEVGNDSIRKIDLTSNPVVVSTIAGVKAGGGGFADGIGTAAEFDFPNALFGDATYLYIVDDNNHVIRRMRFSDSAVTTLVGFVNDADFVDGTGALTPTPTTTDIPATNDVSDRFLVQSLDPNSPILSKTVTVTVTGTPTLTTVSANSGLQGTSNSITLTGTGFVPGGTAVDSGAGVTVSAVNVASTTSLTATFTIDVGAALGARNVSVTTDVGTSGFQTYTVNIAAPIITGITPGSGTQGDTVSVTIEGTSFTGTSVNVSGGAVTVPSFSVDSLTQISAVLVLSSTAGVPTVTVTTSSGTSAPFPFTITASGIATAGDFDAITLAGSEGFGSEDGTGPAAAFDNPFGVFSDGTNVYVTDHDNHTIRKIVISTGVTTTLAGEPGVSGSADAATGSDARFNNPAGIWGDGGSNLYVADISNNTIRKVTTAGVVTTIAGDASQPAGSTNATGPAARFSSPFGIWGNGSGDLFVTDQLNHTIRKITSAAVVTTLAGSAGISGTANGAGSSGRFNGPSGITGSGTTLYVADTNNHTIRSIDTSSGNTVATLAGSAGVPGFVDNSTLSSARFDAPTGISGDLTDGLFVADLDNNAIRKILSGGVTTPAGDTSGTEGYVDATGNTARFKSPVLLYSDGSDVVVADGLNHAIRSIDLSDDSVTTLAGSPNPKSGTTDDTGNKARFDFPGGTWGDGQGNLYVSDTDNHTIRKVVLSTGVVSTVAGSAGTSGTTNGAGTAATFNFPEGMWGDGQGNLYVADTANHTIRHLDLTTNPVNVTTFAGSAGTSGSAEAVGTAATFSSPHAIWGDATNLYIADKGNNKIRGIVRSSKLVSTYAGTGVAGLTNGPRLGTAQFSGPLGIWGNGMNIYVADGFNNQIRKITSGGIVSLFAGDASGVSGQSNGFGAAADFNFPHSLWGDGTNLYVVDLSNDSIRRVRLVDAFVTTILGSSGSSGFVNATGTDARFDSPQTIWGDGDNLYISGGNNHQIRKVSVAGL